MMEPAVVVERAGGMARCILNRPPLNLFEPGIIAAVREAFTVLAGDAGVRVAVLAARGRAFAAGMDVRVLAGLDVAAAKALITATHQAIEAVHEAPFPVIAEVQGPCLGAAFELAMACDMRVASTAATFGLPEVRVGVPSVIEAALLPALVGPGRAAELLLCGTAVGAARALEWGLVNRAVAPERLRAAVDELAGEVLACAPGAVRLQKELIIRWRKTDLAAAIHLGINAFAASSASGEAREGARAFLEKRPPRYREP